jgi:mono/diheme cytochrome c family protein
MQRRRWIIPLLLAVLAAENAWFFYPELRGLVVQAEESDETRGRRVAAELGCFNCHGPGGRGGVPNPGSKLEAIPAWNGGTPMMFAHGDDDLREYMLDGAPRAKRERSSYKAEMEAQAISMPAFRGWVSDADVRALIALVRASSELLEPKDEAAKRGAEVARAKGCFSCHGEMGSGGHPNPGSLKGYIPGFVGRDFTELARDDAELRGWITDGGIARLRDDPIASFFLERQRIKMPRFGRFLSTSEVDDLVAYVRWLASAEWRAQGMHD